MCNYSIESKCYFSFRYSLTDDGYLLGKRLQAAEFQDGDKRESHQVISKADSSLPQQLQQGTREISNEIILPSFSYLHQDISSDTDDDDNVDLSRVITESLLSFSQERSANSSTSSSSITTSRAVNEYSSREQHGEAVTTDAGPSSGSFVDLSDSILVVSDEDVVESPVAPSRTWARFHSLSPTQSSPPQFTSLARLPRSEHSIEMEAVNLITASSIRHSNISLDKARVHSPDKSPDINKTVPSACIEDILEISDDDTDKVVSKKVEHVTSTNLCESEDEELPDLDIPLWKRLAQKGHADSGLLKNLASSLAFESSASQNVVCDTNREVDCQQRHHHRDQFSNIKDKPLISSHQTSKSRTVIPHTAPRSTLHNGHVSSSSHSAQNSGTVSVRNTHNLVSEDTSDAVPVDVRMKNTADKSSVNSRNVMCTPNLPSCVTTSGKTSLVDCNPAFTFSPGSFDIILCVDNREFYGR